MLTWGENGQRYGSMPGSWRSRWMNAGRKETPKSREANQHQKRNANQREFHRGMRSESLE